MSTAIPRYVLENFLLGPVVGRRFMQDSPILPDVWFEFGEAPARRRRLLVTPYETTAASRVAYALAECLAPDENAEADPADPSDLGFDAAYLHGVVSADLKFDELIVGALPMTSWWSDGELDAVLTLYREDKARLRDFVVCEATAAFGSDAAGDRAGAIRELASDLLPMLKGEQASDEPELERRAIAAANRLAMSARYLAAIGLILHASGMDQLEIPKRDDPDAKTWPFRNTPLLQTCAGRALDAMLRGSSRQRLRKLVYNISRDRTAALAVRESVPATKADAARRLFKIDCREINWAIVDSGINGDHKAFLDPLTRQSRVVMHYDFTRVRDILSIRKARFPRQREKLVEELSATQGVESEEKRKLLRGNLQLLAENARHGRGIDWNLIQPFVEVENPGPPKLDHGTHVAGILGANWTEDNGAPGRAAMEGMCPDIRLHDFRVVGQDVESTEFAIIAALQYIRHLNRQNDFIAIHGANLSLSIPHDVRNYACGSTPICNECEKLVGSGVVVVAAAGNLGYQLYETRDGIYESFSAFNVTDPGNAENVITVGATHRFWPHTYGVSFFSSRGPTGDGRMKPDLVAPGEKIVAPLGLQEYGPLDGTSMAAPHVSGAAAMLMARYSELRGQPRRIKEILCKTATDLGRERSFQGHGMLDVLRALQLV